MRVAVLGAGYAGLTIARKLEDALPDAVDIVIVDESPDHLVQHELHRVIRRPSLADEITIPLADLLDRATVETARVTDVDAAAGEAALDGERTLEWDAGAVALGATTDFHDLPGVEANATPLKRLEHASRIREGYERVLERDGRVVVGGAGLSGVQVAGELAAMAEEADADPEILLLERLDAVTPTFPRPFQAAVREALEGRGVTVRTGVPITGADGDEITVENGAPVAYDQFVWTGGIRGSPPLSERPAVRADLRLAGDTFAVGDAARVIDAEGEAVPATAQAAIGEARVAAHNVARLVEHHRDGTGFEPRLDRYTFDPRGWLVSVGDGAVAQVGSRVFTGRAAIALKATVGAGYLGSVGAVANAVDLVRSELSLGSSEGGAPGEDEGDAGTAERNE
ncbi:MAG: NAD(P)/FAD-dependent oxidoreductase [Haloarculaceae archaeon]